MQPSAALTVIAAIVLAGCHDRIVAPTSHPIRANAGYGQGGLAGTGGKIAFMSRLEVNDDIWIMNTDGTALTNLTRGPAREAWPDWSGNGKQIVFASDRDNDGFRFDLYVMNADGTGIQRLTSTLDREEQPKFSPNGKQILFTRRLVNDQLDVFAMNADGTAEVNVTNNAAADNDPTWSADGKQIAFVSTRDEFEEIYVVNADGSGLRRLTVFEGSLGRVDYLAWSPDGKQIAFAAGEPHTLYTIQADGTGLVEIAGFSQFLGGIDWSPNGKQLVFALGANDTFDLFKINVDGTGLTQITFSQMNIFPSWTR